MEPENSSDILNREILTPKRLHCNSVLKSRGLSLKIEIADFAISNSINAASKKYSCDRKSVQTYVNRKRQYEDLLQSPGACF